MKAILHLFGFTKEVDISNCMYEYCIPIHLPVCYIVAERECICDNIIGHKELRFEFAGDYIDDIPVLEIDSRQLAKMYHAI